MDKVLAEKLTMIYLEKCKDSIKSPEDLVDLYWDTIQKIKKYKSPVKESPNWEMKNR